MKIALYAGMFRPNQDGSAKTLLRLIQGLAALGHEVAVWAFSFDTDNPPPAKQHLLPSRPLPFYRDYGIAWINSKTRRQLDSFKPDIVHISAPDLAGRAFQAWARENGLPAIATYHTDFPTYLETYRLQFFQGALWNYFHRFYNRCEMVLTPTEASQRELQRRGIDNSAIWSRGIDRRVFNPDYYSEQLRLSWQAADQPVVLYCGRLVWYKGLDVFCRVYRHYRSQQRKGPRFVLVGNGPIEAELQSRMPDAVFCGHLGGADLAAAYASSDVFLFPSASETFGNVVLEALACGLPAVVSDRGGCQEIVRNSGAGLVAAEGNPGSFIKALDQLLADPEKLALCRKNGLDYAAAHDWGDIIEQMAYHYQDAVRIKKRATNLPQGKPLLLPGNVSFPR